MSKYKYTAISLKDNSIVRDKMEASSEREVRTLLSRRNMEAVNIKTDGIEALDRFDWRKSRIRRKDKILFTRQLSTLVNAGVPLTQALRMVTSQTDSEALAKVLEDVMRQVEGGSSFTDALASHPEHFSKIFINLTRVGETSGTLDESLLRLADQQEKDAAILSKVRGALIYPAIVVSVVVGVVVFMLTVVLPVVNQLYTDLGSDIELPLVTRILLAISQFLIAAWPLVIAGFLMIVLFIRRASKTAQGRQVFDILKLGFPVFGGLFTKLYMARFCRTMQTLLSSGVQMLESLDITSDTINNYYIGRDVEKAIESVKVGGQLSHTLEDSKYFPALVSDMVSIGEQSGDIDGLLDKSATYYEQELDDAVSGLSTAIEPIMMVMLAVVVGGLIAAILLPVYNLINSDIGL